MRVRVEEAVDHHLLVEGLEQLLRRGRADRALGRDRDRSAGDVAHHQEAAGREVGVDRRDGEAVERRDHLPHPGHVLGFVPEVQLAVERFGQVLEHGFEVDHRLQTRPVARLLGEHLEQREVLLDQATGLGTLHLDHGLLAVREDRAVDLGDRARGERLGLDVLEDVFPRHAELLLHHEDDLLLRQRRHVVLELRQLLDEFRRQEVGPRRQDLSELAEGGPELLERLAHPLCLARPPDGPLFVRSSEELLQTVLREDRRDLRSACHQVGLGFLHRGAGAEHAGRRRGARRRYAVGGVDDDHGASRVVTDPVRDVAEQEFLPARHPGVPDHEDVDRSVLGRADDRHRGVGIDDHMGASTVAGEPQRLGLQRLGRAGGLGALGRAEFRIRGVRRHDHLHEMELGIEPTGEVDRPLDRLGRGLGQVGADHDALDRPVGVRDCTHARIMPCAGPRWKRWRSRPPAVVQGLARSAA